VRHVASDVIKETEALSMRTQSANTKRLAERLHDINYWKAELQREITDIISETDLLCQQKLRLENALRATEIPLHIATDNLHCRQRRQGIDLVQDDVEICLLKVRDGHRVGIILTDIQSATCQKISAGRPKSAEASRKGVKYRGKTGSEVYRNSIFVLRYFKDCKCNCEQRITSVSSPLRGRREIV